MARVLLIGLAGALGTLARYGVGLWAGRTFGVSFPYGTLFINVVGSFIVGWFIIWTTEHVLLDPRLRLGEAE